MAGTSCGGTAAGVVGSAPWECSAEVAAAWGKGRLSIVAAKGRAEAGMGPSGEFCSAAHAEALPSPRDFKA